MKAISGCFLAVFCLLSFTPSLSADTFTVTQGTCEGAGSLRDAVNQANANPGKDTINFDAGVTTVSPSFGSNCQLAQSIVITESVDIIGNGTSKLSISDNVTWVTPSGNVNAALVCDDGNILVADGTVPFIIDGFNNPVVTIKDLTFRKNFGVIETRSNPGILNMENVVIRDSYSGTRRQCNGPLVEITGELNMTDVALFFNKMTNVSPRDAIVRVNGNARLQGVRFSSNRAGTQFLFSAREASDKVTIRESSFSSQQPRVYIVGGTADIVNTLVVGESQGAGVWGTSAVINLINSTISLPGQVTTGLGLTGPPAGATHIWVEGAGRATLFNTVVDARLPIATSALPLVGTSGTALIEASTDSHITDGSGPTGPSSGNANLSGNLVPLGAPTLDGGNDGSAFDPESFPNPLATDLEGNPRIQGPSVDKGAIEILSNYSGDDRYTVQQDVLFASGAASVLDNDTSYTAAATLTAVLQSQPSSGTLNFNTDGTFTYQPPAGFYGGESFTYYMAVNGVPANTATVVLDIQPPFPIRTAPDAYTINEGTPLVTHSSNAPLSNDDVMGFIYASGPKGAILQVVDAPDNAAPGGFDFPPDGIFSYTPVPGFSGTDTFTYHVWFEKLGVAGSAETTVTINVLDVNDPPVAQDDAYSTQQGISKVFTRSVLENDTDPDGNTLTIVKKSDPAHSTLTISGRYFSLTNLDPNFSGTDSFTYAASDGKLESNIATVTITVNATNKPPLAQSDKYRLPAESLFTVPVRGGVLRNDSDPDGDALRVSLVTNAMHGSVQLQDDGAFNYQPNAGFTGVDTFEYDLTDGKDTVIGSVNLIVTAINQPPVANAESYTVVQDTTLTVPAPSLLANDSDPENHELYLNIGQLPAHGQYTFSATGDFIYTPDPEYVGSDTIGYTVSDGELESTPVAVVITVTAAPANEPPIAHDDAWTVQQDGFLDVAAPGVLGNDTDPEGHSLTVDILTPPAVGVFTKGVNGAFSYRPPAGYSGPVSFTYTVNDGHSDSAPATVLITVTEKNHPPVANDDGYWMNANLTLDVSAPGLLSNDTEPDGDTVTVILSGSPSHGLLSSDGNGGFQYSPEFGFAGADSFTYKLSDGVLESNDATVQITVSSFNRAPVALDDAYAIPQDTVLDVSAPGVLVNDGDPEGHPLTVTVTSQPAHGHLSPHPDGSFTYIPDPVYFGVDSFKYTANDGVIDSLEATVQLTVDADNLPPVANDDNYSAVQGAVLSVAAPGIIANDSDPEGHQLTATLLTQPSDGHLVVTGGGGFDYYPDAGFTGQDSFTYQVSDGQLDSNEATVTVNVVAATSLLSVFTTSIDFTDNNPGAVTATLACNTGLPLSQSFDISEGSPVQFVVTNLPFTTSGTQCEIALSGLGANYTLNPTSCVFTYGGFAEDGANFCAFVATATAASYTVSKHWVLNNMASEQLDDVGVTITCSDDILSVDGVDYAGGSSVVVSIGDQESVAVTVDTTIGAARCSATEQLRQSGVEVEYSEDCSNATLTAGGSASCTITNTVFFEGVPALDRYGVALLALLLMGVGLTGIRRFV